LPPHDLLAEPDHLALDLLQPGDRTLGRPLPLLRVTSRS
jgi:hypothetical protein